MEGLSELGTHLCIQVVLLLEALLARFHGVLDHLLGLGALDRVEDVCNPLVVEAVPVALVGQVPEGSCLGLGQLKHALNGEALDLQHRGHKDLVPGDVLKSTTIDLIFLPLWPLS